MNTYLIEQSKINKFFKILNKLDRHNSEIYGCCQKEVFVRRTINKWLTGKYIVLYTPVKENQYREHITIINISYYLGYGEELKIQYYDYTRPCHYFSRKLSQNDCMRLEGEFTNGDTHKLLLELTSLNLPKKTFKFKAYNKNLEEIVWTTEASTYFEALNNANNNTDDLMIYEYDEKK